jgi:hypothetical protein
MEFIRDFNRRLAEKITAAVSTMWCAYLFALLALISLPAAIRSQEILVIIAWIAQTFLQLVLLSIIMVGQSASAAIVARKIDETHSASLSEFELAKEARNLANEELAEIKELTREVHEALKDIKGRNNP